MNNYNKVLDALDGIYGFNDQLKSTFRRVRTAGPGHQPRILQGHCRSKAPRWATVTKRRIEIQ